MSYIGQWQFQSAENLKAFMRAIGAPADVAEAADTMMSVVDITKSGDDYTIKSKTAKGEMVYTFKLGRPVEIEILGSGKKFTVVASTDGDKLTLTGQGSDAVTETREVQGDTMIISLTKPGVDVVGKRILKRV